MRICVRALLISQLVVMLLGTGDIILHVRVGVLGARIRGVLILLRRGRRVRRGRKMGDRF